MSSPLKANLWMSVTKPAGYTTRPSVWTTGVGARVVARYRLLADMYKVSVPPRKQRALRARVGEARSMATTVVTAMLRELVPGCSRHSVSLTKGWAVPPLMRNWGR